MSGTRPWPASRPWAAPTAIWPPETGPTISPGRPRTRVGPSASIAARAIRAGAIPWTTLRRWSPRPEHGSSTPTPWEMMGGATTWIRRCTTCGDSGCASRRSCWPISTSRRVRHPMPKRPAASSADSLVSTRISPSTALPAARIRTPPSTTTSQSYPRRHPGSGRHLNPLATGRSNPTRRPIPGRVRGPVCGTAGSTTRSRCRSFWRMARWQTCSTKRIGKRSRTTSDRSSTTYAPIRGTSPTTIPCWQRAKSPVGASSANPSSYTADSFGSI